MATNGATASSTDADKPGDALKAFAQKTLPTLREHLQQAQSVNDQVKNAK